MQDEVRKRIRFKDLDTNEQEVLDDDQYEEVFLDLVNYLRYMQNSRGTIVRCLIDVQTMTDRNSFLAFVTLPPSGRGGEADGTVNYDADIALKNEEINKIGAFAPSIIAPGSTSSNNQSASSARGGTTNTSTSSDEEKQLENFKKKFKPSEQTYPELSSDAQYVKWKSLFEAKLKLADLGQIAVSTYTAPVSPPASTAAVELLTSVKNANRTRGVRHECSGLPVRVSRLTPANHLLSSTSPLTCYYPRFHQSRTRNT
mmetsp:Transcript_12868/g.21165  ORF Transcript_12868/g.21165 Transcript_12868/m.21165 type:complete len:257 (+) Transcript_12868:102-872(+)